MNSNFQYQALHSEGNDTDLWDELDDVESREVQQHQSRFHAASPYSRSRPGIILMSIAQSTAEKVSSSAASALDAARQSWNQYPHQPPSNNTDLDFDRQFGIDELRPTEFEDREDHQTRNDTTTQNPFVLLSNFSRHSIFSPRDHWGVVANMDVFLKHLYEYYYYRGMLPIVSKFIVEACTLLFTLWLSRILIKKVDWVKLSSCEDEKSCEANWSDYYRTEPLGWFHLWTVEVFQFLMLGYFVFFVWSFLQSYKQYQTCQFILHDKLGISRRKLQGGAVLWDTVVTKLIEVQDSGDYRLALRSLDALRISQRIMRKENFLIAFWNQKLLDTKIGDRQFWCSSLEWCVYTCVLNFMFNHKYEIRPAFYLDADSLERRLKLCAIIHTLLLPFLIIFVIIHFLFKNVYDFKSTEQYMGNRSWSGAAVWTFREFNELPHVFQQRLEPSYEAAEKYLMLFGQSEWKAALGRLCVFIGGAFGFVLLLLGFVNDAILLHVQLWGRNLLWYAGIAGVIYGIGKALIPAKEAQPSVTRNLFDDMDIALKNVSTHTHYYPESWKGKGWDPHVCNAFGQMFDSKVKLFIWELAAFVCAPYILYAKLSKCAPAICEFCLLIKARIPGHGDVCGFSTFDFDNYKDEAWDGKTLGKNVVEGADSLSESLMRKRNVEDAKRDHPKPQSREGKMEKSFFGFQAVHPRWKCSESGQSLLTAVDEYRNAAIIRERELHIEAATLQLQTLARIEQKQAWSQQTEAPITQQLSHGHLTTMDGNARNLESVAIKQLSQRSMQNSEKELTTDMTQNWGQTTVPGGVHFPLELSTDLRSILNMSPSSLEVSRNIMDEEKNSHQAPPVADAHRRERQYYWLERFHTHLEKQKQQEEKAASHNDDQEDISRSMPNNTNRVANNDTRENVFASSVI